MKSRRLVYRGLIYHRRTHLGALLTAALTAAVIVAALAVGDSVRSGMERVERARTGRIGFAAHAGDRTWTSELATAMARELELRVSACLQLNGTVSLPDGSNRIARALVLGVDEEFWRLSPGGRAPLARWPEDAVAVSESVARRLRLSVGDPLIVRLEKTSAVPSDTPLSSDTENIAVLSATVAAVVGADSFGSFSLRIGALAPANVFLPLDRLQRIVDEPGRANTLLIEVGPESEGNILQAVGNTWRLDDTGLALEELSGGRGWELTSRRILLGPSEGEAAEELTGAQGILTWLVNEFALRDRTTPYSFVAALPHESPLIPDDLADDEITVNTWLAQDLVAKPGDTVSLTYFVLGDSRRLEERTTDFRIRAVVPIEAEAADRDLMPAYPGLAGTENCRDWDPGFLLDLDRIRDRDEAYWDRYRGTPKAFLSLAAGKALWRNRFGELTAIRLPPGTDVSVLEEQPSTWLHPEMFGFQFVNLRETGAASRADGSDFGMLFLGFSAFLVGAALILMGLVVALNVSMRRPEIATLLALGYTPRRIRRLFAVEHAVVSLAGGLVGALGGLALGAAALAALDSVWSDVAGSLELSLDVRPMTLIVGALSGSAISFAVAYLVIRRSVRGSVQSAFTRQEELAARLARSRGRRCVACWVALVFAVSAVALALLAGTGRDPATAGAFFGSGALLLCAGLSLAWYSLAHVGVGTRMSGSGLAWRNLGRRRGRSLAVIGVLAFGVFMFFGVSVFRRDRLEGPGDRAGGTGGFALVGESSAAIVHDLDTPEGRRAYALSDADLEGVSVVGLRVREGDDASCRSLTRAQIPTVVGVDPSALSGRFTFTGGYDWTALADGAVIDQATFWTLGKGLGDTIDLTDERGRPNPVRIAGVIDNSVLHGRIVVSEESFKDHFPSVSGHRMFLIDAPGSRRDEVAALLSRQMEDRGLSLERSEDRLNSYNAVENTYLGIFQALGGIGLLLGSAGLALVVGRNALERRKELALLGAVGFTRNRIVRLVTAEHTVLLGLGLLAGVLASLLSIIPAILAPGARVATPAMAVTLAALAVGGYLWTRIAARLALRGPLLRNLQEE